jgi:hypothetical protein
LTVALGAPTQSSFPVSTVSVRQSDALAFIADQRKMIELYEQLKNGTITLAQLGAQVEQVGNAYEGVTNAGRKRSPFDQEVIAELEKPELWEEGAQAWNILKASFGDQAAVNRAYAENEIQRSHHAIEIAERFMAPSTRWSPGQVCSACYGKFGSPSPP